MSPLRAQAMPLEEFPEHMRRAIAEAVAAPAPPPRYILIGHPEDPFPLAEMDSRGWWEWHWQRGVDPEKARVSIPAGMRAQVITRDGLVCALCGGDVDLADVHIDHRHPVALAGPTELSNLQVTHSLCNMRKGARPCHASAQ